MSDFHGAAHPSLMTRIRITSDHDHVVASPEHGQALPRNSHDAPTGSKLHLMVSIASCPIRMLLHRVQYP
eukprot:1207535-Rhodomonas_salina.3